jgi:hypothetical protein
MSENVPVLIKKVQYVPAKERTQSRGIIVAQVRNQQTEGILMKLKLIACKMH